MCVLINRMFSSCEPVKSGLNAEIWSRECTLVPWMGC